MPDLDEIKLFGQSLMRPLSLEEKDAIASLIGTNRDAYVSFEQAYAEHCMDSDGCFGPAATAVVGRKGEDAPDADSIVQRIVDEFIYAHKRLPAPDAVMTKEELLALPAEIRPMCTSTLMRTDVQSPSISILMEVLQMAYSASDVEEYMHKYGLFRAMLETLDLDAYSYEMLGRNRCSMGYWFPALKEAAERQNFFKIPETKIIKVPLEILQMSRLGYETLNDVTKRIIDEFCMKAFDLDVNKSYFIKTGVFSCKYDFRNCKVTGAKEVRELGEYLLYVTGLACGMASPLNHPTIYGAATTNEWVVREFIEDVEDNPCIYHGMPLHTEYRFFVDLDTKEVIGVSPYWRSDVMKKRFGGAKDRNTPDMIHDYIAYTSHEKKLMQRYNDNVKRVSEAVQKMIQNMNLAGQWSLDVMQNGDDFYAIDMAPADMSALNDVVPKEKLMRTIPDIRAYLPQITTTEMR